MKYILPINEYKVNKSYLYHTTSLNGIYDILHENILKKSDMFTGVSFTRDKNFWYRHRAIRLVLDRDLLSQNYKIVPYDYFNDKNYKDDEFIFGTQKDYFPKSAIGSNRKAPFEYEEYVEKDIKNISKYLVAIEINSDVLLSEYSKKYLQFLDDYVIKNQHIKIRIVDRKSLDNNYVSYVKESNSNNFYTLFNELVYIDSINRWGDEIKVEYTKADGSQHTYVGDDIDFKEDFIESGDSFEFKKEEPKVEIPKEIVKKKMKYNIVFYIGKKNMGIIKRGIENQQFAYALKNTLNKDPKYRMGRIEVESYETI